MRKAGFWLESYMKYTQQSEAPDNYHLWTGVSVIASCLRRKAWLNWGFFDIYPNMYIILIGPPGARKNTAISIGVALTDGIKGIFTGSDCTTGPALIEAIKECEIEDTIDGKSFRHSSITIVSKEFVNFITVDKDLITWLTDLFDTHAVWTYRTKGKGTYPIKGVWLNLIGGITPTGFSKVVPDEVIGEGFPSRVVFVVADGPRHLKARPQLTLAERQLRLDLVEDLHTISQIKGEFNLAPDATEWYTNWYENPIEDALRSDKRFSGYFARKHIHLLKTAMVVSACTDDSRIVSQPHIEYALTILEATEAKMIEAFGATGRSIMSSDIDDVIKLLKKYKRISKDQILSQIWRDINPMHIDHVFNMIKEMDLLTVEVDVNEKVWYKWKEKPETPTKVS